MSQLASNSGNVYRSYGIFIDFFSDSTYSAKRVGTTKFFGLPAVLSAILLPKESQAASFELLFLVQF